MATLALELKKHVKIRHSVTHPCDLCEYAAGRADTLRRHKSTVHEGKAKRFYCNLCDYSVSNVTVLKRHKVKAHWSPSADNRSADT